MSLRVRLARSRLCKLLGGIAIKAWAFSGAYVLLCFILYWLYGGIFAFFLLCFATTGKSIYIFLTHFMIENGNRIIRFCTGLLYRTEDHLLYHPELPAHSRVYVPAPSMFNLPYQSVYTRSGDGTMLHMFFIAQPLTETKNAPTVLYLHGNAGNMGHR